MKYSYDRSEIKKISLSGFLSMVSVRNKMCIRDRDSPGLRQAHTRAGRRGLV